MALSESTIVVLPGWGHDLSSWKGFVSTFPQGKVRVIELPGFGAEPLVSTTWGIPEFALWVREKIEREGWTNIVLLGHSFGGRIAGVLASEHPSWLAGLILYGAPVLYRPSFGTTLKMYVARLVKPFVPHTLRTKLVSTPDIIDARAQGLEETFRRVIPYDLTKELPHIQVPTLLVWGAHDTYPPLRIAEEAQNLIPGSTLALVEGAGHNAHLERPELFYARIVEFLK